MSTTDTTSAFAVEVVPFEATDDHVAFTSTRFDHQSGHFSVTGFESVAGDAHVTAYAHEVTGVSFEPGLNFEGMPSVRLRIAGDVPATLVLFGVSLADVLVAAAAAIKDAS